MASELTFKRNEPQSTMDAPSSCGAAGAQAEPRVRPRSSLSAVLNEVFGGSAIEDVSGDASASARGEVPAEPPAQPLVRPPAQWLQAPESTTRGGAGGLAQSPIQPQPSKEHVAAVGSESPGLEPASDDAGLGIADGLALDADGGSHQRAWRSRPKKQRPTHFLAVPLCHVCTWFASERMSGHVTRGAVVFDGCRAVHYKPFRCCGP